MKVKARTDSRKHVTGPVNVRVRTKVRAGGDPQGQHNETLVRSSQPRAQTARPAGVRVKTKVRTGDPGDPQGQHNETLVRV